MVPYGHRMALRPFIPCPGNLVTPHEWHALRGSQGRCIGAGSARPSIQLGQQGWLLGDLVLDAGEAEAVIRDRYDFGPRAPLTVTVPLEGS